ncbi:MAG: serine protease [Methylovirgula sp.]
MIDPLLLTTVRIATFKGDLGLTNATGFFFERDKRLFLATSRHVVFDEPTQHFPDRIQIELHIDQSDMAQSTQYSIPLYQNDKALWRQGVDSAGKIDVTVIEIDRKALPKTAVYRAFTPKHLLDPARHVDIGTPLVVVGFPLGFHDTLHHMPVARLAGLASSFGLRFQGQGYFLTDARTHRGTSGAPVVMRAEKTGWSGAKDFPWMILGVHSSRVDVTRDLKLDEALGLNCAWYADILMTLTQG